MNQGGGKPSHSLNCCDDFADAGVDAVSLRRRGGVDVRASWGAASSAPTVPIFTAQILLLRCCCDWRNVFFEVAEEQGVEMERGAWAFVYGVGAVGVFHEVYWLV